MVQLLGLLTLLLTLVLPANLSTGSRLQTQQPRSKCPSLGIVASTNKGYSPASACGKRRVARTQRRDWWWEGNRYESALVSASEQI